MNKKDRLRVLLEWMVLLSISVGASWAEIRKPSHPRWKPEPDRVYLQDVGQRVRSASPILSAAWYGERLFAGDAAGLLELTDGNLVRVTGPSGPVRRLKAIQDVLYAATERGLWRLQGASWQPIGERPVADVCLHLGVLLAASGNQVWKVEGDRLVSISDSSRFPVEGVASYSGNVYVRHPQRLGVLEGKTLTLEDVQDWGNLPTGSSTRDFLSLGSRLLVATDRGLAALRGMTWYETRGEDGLCYEDTTCLAEGFAGDLWIGTTRGAIRQVGAEFHYYGSGRWLPHDRVNAVAVGGSRVCIATDGGLGLISYEPYTLRKKAAWYERWLEEWGMKRLGFTHALGKRNGEWLRVVGENDVGFSAHYLAARCYEYGVTRDPAARAAALDSMTMIKWSEEITTIPGFPARSIWAVGQKGIKAKEGSDILTDQWHPTPDGCWEWKGNTSSDETDAHAYAVTLFLELVAEGRERDMAVEHLRRVFGHIVDHGWTLRDVDGLPTRWARWDPEYLNSPNGFLARGLNGLEAFSMVTSSFHFTKDAKFQKGREHLLQQGYLKDILRQKQAFPPGLYTDHDDRLAFLAYDPLLRYETDPKLRSLWLRSLERSWEVKRIESVPWYNYIYGAATGNDCESDRAAAHLRDWPLDLVAWSQFNSHRHDIRTPKGYRNYSDRIRALSPREVGPQRVNRDWTVLDNDGKGNSVVDPACWLEQYWMGRYYGFIEAPTATDRELLSVPHRGLRLGAEPYGGPPRPQLPIKPPAGSAAR